MRSVHYMHLSNDLRIIFLFCLIISGVSSAVLLEIQEYCSRQYDPQNSKKSLSTCEVKSVGDINSPRGLRAVASLAFMDTMETTKVLPSFCEIKPPRIK